MTAHHAWLKLSSLVSILILGASMSACGNSSTWKEEVLLHDGSKIIVERTMKRGGRHEIGQRGGSVYQSLTFQMPGTQTDVEWEDKLSEDLGTASFMPMTLDVVNGSAYVVASPAGCLSHNKWGRPNPPYVVFKYQGQDWSRIPLEQLPAEVKLPNLILSSPDDEAKKIGGRVVSAQAIKQLNASLRMPEELNIVREPVKEGALGCPAMILYDKNGWVALDWFTDQPSLPACLKFCEFKKVSAEACPCNSIFKGKQ